jgi:hypothetical protein
VLGNYSLLRNLLIIIFIIVLLDSVFTSRAKVIIREIVEETEYG